MTFMASIVGGLLFTLAGATAFAQGAPGPGPSGSTESAIDLVDGASREITVGDTPKVEIRYAVKLPSSFSQTNVKVTVKPMTLLRGPHDESTFMNAHVSADLLAEESVLRLTLDLEKESLKPGTYDLRLKLAAGDERGGVKVQFIVPSAELEQPPKQVIELIDGEARELPRLHLHARSDGSHASIQSIEVTGLRQGEAEREPMLSFLLPSKPIARKGDAWIEVKLKDPNKLPPLGTSTGTVRIQAPELEQPVDVAYEIRVRRSASWIVYATLAGLLCSLLREGLTFLQKSSEAQRSAREAIARLEAEMRRRPDEDLRGAVGEALTTLRAERLSRRPENITLAITMANEALARALKDLNERKEKARKRYADIAAILKMKLQLSPGLRNGIDAASASLVEAAESLRVGDVKSADEHLGSIDVTLDEVVKEGRTYRDTLRKVLFELSPLASLASDPRRGTTRRDVEDALNEADGASIKERLEQLDRISREVALLERSILDDIMNAVEAVQQISKANEPPPPVVKLRDEMARLVQMHNEDPDKPEAVLGELAATIPALFRAALTALLPRPASEDARKSIFDRVDKGDYLGAVSLVQTEIDRPVFALEGAPRGDGTGAVVSAVPAPARGAIKPSTGARAGAVVGLMLPPDPGDASTFMALIGRPEALWEIRLMIAILVGAAVTAAAFITYDKPTFFGTWPELGAIFLWALSFNMIGIEALTTLATKLPGRSSI